MKTETKEPIIKEDIRIKECPFLYQKEYVGDNLQADKTKAFKTVIISAYPCCGKSYAFEHQDELTMLDSDSSEFSWLKDSTGKNTTQRNPEFPKNYIKHIKDNIGKVDIIFVSSHLVVREALTKAGITFNTVYPKNDARNEWISRMEKRGNNDSFIKFQEDNWDKFTNSIFDEPHGAQLILLDKNSFIDPIYLWVTLPGEIKVL